MDRVRHGALKQMATASGKVSANYLSDVINGRKVISKSRANELAELSKDALGVHIPAQMWMFGPYPALKAAVSARGRCCLEDRGDEVLPQ